MSQSKKSSKKHLYAPKTRHPRFGPGTKPKAERPERLVKTIQIPNPNRLGGSHDVASHKILKQTRKELDPLEPITATYRRDWRHLSFEEINAVSPYFRRSNTTPVMVPLPGTIQLEPFGMRPVEGSGAQAKDYKTGLKQIPAEVYLELKRIFLPGYDFGPKGLRLIYHELDDEKFAGMGEPGQMSFVGVRAHGGWTKGTKGQPKRYVQSEYALGILQAEEGDFYSRTGTMTWICRIPGGIISYFSQAVTVFQQVAPVIARTIAEKGWSPLGYADWFQKAYDLRAKSRRLDRAHARRLLLRLLAGEQLEEMDEDSLQVALVRLERGERFAGPLHPAVLSESAPRLEVAWDDLADYEGAGILELTRGNKRHKFVLNYAGTEDLGP